MVKVHFKLTSQMLENMFTDLRRPHSFAEERAAFIGCKVSQSDSGLIVLAHTYIPLQDDWYIDDPRFGCTFGTEAMHTAMQFSLTNSSSIFHVHLHEHFGLPSLSRTDFREYKRFVPDFLNVQPNMPHGAIVFSEDSALGLCWHPKYKHPIIIDRLTVVGSPMKFLGPIYA